MIAFHHYIAWIRYEKFWFTMTRYRAANYCVTFHPINRGPSDQTAARHFHFKTFSLSSILKDIQNILSLESAINLLSRHATS